MLPHLMGAGDSMIHKQRHVLVADDSAAHRRMLAGQLLRWGYQVAEAASGAEALSLARAADFDIILSDWVMPGMTGPEFCRAYRALPARKYGYFVLISAKSGKAEIADGLESGADDFLTKPFDATELLARLHAGERILGMQAELRQRNSDLERLYGALQRDLAEARRLQLSLVPENAIRLPGAELLFLLQPSGALGGDLVGWFPTAADRILFFAIDVAGHGIAPALMTARLSALLSAQSRDQNLAFRNGRPLSPEDVVARLNRLLMSDQHGDLYLTMICAELNLSSGLLRFVQAGHPHPVLARGPGMPRLLGDGGLPVGLVEQADYPAHIVQLAAGDRLFIGSDGFTECPGPGGDLGDEGMLRLVTETATLSGQPLARALCDGLVRHSGLTDFPDDISAIVLDWHGPPTV